MSDIKRVTTPFSYSSAVCAGDYVFLGLHRGFGATFTEQISDCVENVKKTLEQCGLSLCDIVKVNVWLKNIKDLQEMEETFFKYYEKDTFPARMTATTEFIDDDCLLMIEGIAYNKK